VMLYCVLPLTETGPEICVFSPDDVIGVWA